MNDMTKDMTKDITKDMIPEAVGPAPRFPLFAMGQLLATPGALSKLQHLQAPVLGLLSRHVHGDWAELDAQDRAQNEWALKEGSRVFSVYTVSAERDGQVASQTFWVITEADRSCTTVLLPEEY